MMVIGLTGSIAMGKSEAARHLASRGFPVFDSDREVHRLYDSEAGAALVRPYIPEATTANKVDRAFVTAAILKDPALLTQLEPLVHAEIRKRRDHFIAQHRALDAKAVILDIPLLFETGSEKQVDRTIVVSSSPEIQRRRALARPGMTSEKLNMILARQMRDGEKQQRADAVIENNSTLQELQNSLDHLLRKWGLLSHA